MIFGSMGHGFWVVNEEHVVCSLLRVDRHSVASGVGEGHVLGAEEVLQHLAWPAVD